MHDHRCSIRRRRPGSCTACCRPLAGRVPRRVQASARDREVWAVDTERRSSRAQVEDLTVALCGAAVELSVWKNRAEGGLGPSKTSKSSGSTRDCRP